MSYTIRWLGQAGYELCDGQVRVMVDPYLSGLVERTEGLHRLAAPVLRPEDAEADLLVSTHDHGDHLDADLAALMRRNGAMKTAGPPSCAAHFAALGYPPEAILPLGRGDTLAFGRFSFTGVYAEHTDDSIGLVVTCDRITAYFTGDSLFTEAFRASAEEVGRTLRPDLLFVCVNGRWGNMDAGEAAETLALCGAQVGVPNHYGMFAENTADPAAFHEAARARGLRSAEMELGRTVDVTELLALS